VKRVPAKLVAVVAICAGLGVLAIEIRRFRSGESTEIWLWGLIALGGIVFGGYELFAPKPKE
jgi:hypothetical protein